MLARRAMATQRGFDYEPHRYGVSPPNQCPDLLDLDPDTVILRIRGDWDKSASFARSFYVVTDDSGRVTHIEARYTYEPPIPSEEQSTRP